MPHLPPTHRSRSLPAIRSHDHRLPANLRGYDAAWQHCRAAFLASFPLCEDCTAAGRCTAADQVHHRLKVSTHPELRLDWDNLMPLCVRCHNVRTRRGE